VHLAVALPDRSSGLTQHIPRIDVPFDVEPMFLPDFELELLTVEISDQIPSLYTIRPRRFLLSPEPRLRRKPTVPGDVFPGENGIPVTIQYGR